MRDAALGFGNVPRARRQYPDFDAGMSARLVGQVDLAPPHRGAGLAIVADQIAGSASGQDQGFQRSRPDPVLPGPATQPAQPGDEGPDVPGIESGFVLYR